MICSICKLNPVKLPMATTCSLECACRMSGDTYEPLNYADVKLRFDIAIADAKKWTRKNSRVKL